MDIAPHARRRKACDLCVTKRIKCDALKPRCSNCVLYGVDCKITATNKGPAASRARAIEKRRTSQVAEEPARIAAVEARISGVEARLQDLEVPPITNFADLTSANLDVTHMDLSLGEENMASNSSVEPFLFPELYGDGPGDVVVQTPHLQLPPLAEISPAIDRYFELINAVIPLFHEPSFKRMLYYWYSPSSQRPETDWAAINIVLALSYRILDDLPLDRGKVAQHSQNVQHVLTNLLLRTDDLLGLQVLLGMVMLYQGAKDSRLANVLIGSAVRLAQSMRLNRRESYECLFPEVAQQRNRTFWIAYCLDKGISLRWNIHSSQSDADIHVELPASTPQDGFGQVCTLDGTMAFSYFRARVQLAHIQGQVYEKLSSTNTHGLPPMERSEAAQRLDTMLDNWQGSIPPPFRVNAIVESMTCDHRLQMAFLHLEHLECWLMINGIFPADSDCIVRIQTYSRSRDVSRAAVQERPQSDTWNKCVHLSRGCLKLAVLAEVSDYSMWLHVYPWMSCLIILLGQMIQVPDHPFVEADRELTASSMELLGKKLDLEAPHEKAIHVAISQLYQQAQESIGPADNRNSVAFLASITIDNPSLPDTLENWVASASFRAPADTT